VAWSVRSAYLNPAACSLALTILRTSLSAGGPHGFLLFRPTSFCATVAPWYVLFTINSLGRGDENAVFRP
jgi:hypothetical protein